MGKLSDTTVASVMDGLFGGQPIVLATHQRIVLSTTQPTNDGSGVTEPTGNGYAPVVVDNDLTTWSATADRLKVNGIVVAFPAVTNADSPDGWGPCSWFAVFDDDTDEYQGNGRIPTVTPMVGDTVTFDIGDMVISGPGS